jgi:hypothetical protein
MSGIRLRTKLEGAATGPATGIVVPSNVVAALDHGQRPPVKVTLNGHATALTRNPRAKNFFATLSNSLRRYHVDNISGAKTDDTRQRRIDKSIALFLDNKPR